MLERDSVSDYLDYLPLFKIREVKCMGEDVSVLKHSKMFQGCGCGIKEMNWESYDKPSFKKIHDGGIPGEQTDQVTMEEFSTPNLALSESPVQRKSLI